MTEKKPDGYEITMAVISISVVVLAILMGYLIGFYVAKHKYQCQQVGNGLVNFRTDKSVYRICR